MKPEEIDYAGEECTPDELHILGREDAQQLAIVRIRHRLERYTLTKERGWLLDLVRRLIERENALRAVAAARQEVIEGLTKRCEAFDTEVSRIKEALQLKEEAYQRALKDVARLSRELQPRPDNVIRG